MKKRLTAAVLALTLAGVLVAFHILRKLDDGAHGSHGATHVSHTH